MDMKHNTGRFNLKRKRDLKSPSPYFMFENRSLLSTPKLISPQRSCKSPPPLIESTSYKALIKLSSMYIKPVHENNCKVK